MTIKQTQVIFYSAAVFNFLAALILFAPTGLAAQLGIHPLPEGGVYESVMVGAIAVFGVGYAWVGRNPKENIGIAKLGLLGKLAVVAVVYSYAFSGGVNLMFAVLVSGDLLYSILFAIYLNSQRQVVEAI